MNGCDWIIYETTGRWAAALRLALERAVFAEGRTPHHEVRHVRDLASRLDGHAACLVAVEVDVDSLAEVLSWLAVAGREFPRARFVALLDRSLCTDSENGPRQDELGDVESALAEAGVIHILHSPRQWPTALALAQRHGATRAAACSALRDDLSLIERVWDRLPWQDMPS